MTDKKYTCQIDVLVKKVEQGKLEEMGIWVCAQLGCPREYAFTVEWDCKQNIFFAVEFIWGEHERSCKAYVGQYIVIYKRGQEVLDCKMLEDFWEKDADGFKYHTSDDQNIDKVKEKENWHEKDIQK